MPFKVIEKTSFLWCQFAVINELTGSVTKEFYDPLEAQDLADKLNKRHNSQGLNS